MRAAVRPRVRSFVRALPLSWMAAGGLAGAQNLPAPPTIPSSLSGSETELVFSRLDPVALGLIGAGALILLLLLVRIVSMVRRERPKAPRAAASRGGPATRIMGDDDSMSRATMSRSTMSRPTLSGQTDWGFDQNKRAALARSPIAVDGGGHELPSLEKAVSQWSTSEVQNAAAISMGAVEAMGRSPNVPPSPYRTSHNPYYKGTESHGAPMEVEEVADTLLQAELLVQLGDPKQAMILLSQHIRETERPGPAVWLMLLGLYQSTGRKSQYEALAKGFGTLFNAAVPPWTTSADTIQRDLESYPRVMMKLTTGWPQREVRVFLESLLNDDRGGSRQGFSLTAYREILFLIEVLGVLEMMDAEDAERGDIQRKLGAA